MFILSLLKLNRNSDDYYLSIHR